MYIISRLIILFSVLLVFQSAIHSQSDLSTEEKVYGLSLFWQEVNYNFAFFHQVPHLDWDSAYTEYITKVIESKSDFEYYQLLQEFCALLKDGHTSIYFPQAIDSLLYRTSFGKYRIFLKNYNGKAIVVRSTQETKDEIPIGSELTFVNGIPTSQYLKEEVLPFISSSTEYVKNDWGVRDLLKGFVGDTIGITIKTPKHEERNFDLVRSKNFGTIYPPFLRKELLEFKWIENDIAYISLNSFNNPEINPIFEKTLPELYNAKYLIIDLRNNQGGRTSVGRQIANYITKKDSLEGSISSTRHHIAVYKAWGAFVQKKDTVDDHESKMAFLMKTNDGLFVINSEILFNPIPLTKRLMIPIVILTGHQTASAAEDFIIMLDKEDHITIMGECTNGSTGQPLFIDLPGGGRARICTKKDLYPDGTEFVGYGIKPDIEITNTVDDLINNNDRVLQTAINYLKSNNHE